MPDRNPIIALCTDFGSEGPYLGQMRAVLHQRAPRAYVIDLFSNLPAHDAVAAAYLLPAYVTDFPEGTVFLCVVDPGVGDGKRRPVVVKAGGHWFVGPENGLFDVIISRAARIEYWHVTWVPERLSSSFHGRDLFAPVAAMLANGEPPPGERASPPDAQPRRPGELAQAVFIDHFGNVVTGVRATAVPPGAYIAVKGIRLERARTFSDVGVHGAFWYANANGLVEIAVNRGRAVEMLGITVGDPIQIGDGTQ